MTLVIKAATAMASSQVHERKQVTISTITHSESSLAAKQSYERRCIFCGGVIHNWTQCPVRDITATNVVLKVALENCVGRRKTFKFNKFNKGTTAALFPNKGTTAALFPLSFCSVLAAG